MQRLLVPPPDLRDPGDPEATRRHRASLAEMLSRDPGASDPGGAPASAAASPDLFGRPDPEAQARIDARLEADVRQMRRRGWRYWIPDADPRLARLAADRPRLLFVAGTPDLQAPAVAVVGTRRPDAYGDAMAGALAGALGRAGAVVVSGGALGVDRRAHEAALDAGGRTTVVLGSGLGRPHPASNRPLFERAVDAGSCVVAELPPSVCARAYTFPRRNRLIAALADAVVVVQAGAVSGALITAERARTAGIPCFAVPGDAWYERSSGTLSLLSSGRALGLGSPADLAGVPGLAGLATTPWPRSGARPWGLPDPWTARPPAPPGPADPASRAVLDALSDGPLDLDALAARSGLAAGALAARLVALEVAGVVIRMPGGTVARPSVPRARGRCPR